MSSPTPSEQPDQVMQDANDKQSQAEEAPVRRTTINDLPPEIVLAIVEHVEMTATHDRLGRDLGRGANHNAAPAGGAAAAGGQGAAGAEAGGPAAGAGGILVDLMNNLLGGAAAAAGRNAAPAREAAPAGGAAPTNNTAPAGAGAQTAASDDDMPPLEAIPAANAPSAASRPAAASSARPAAATTSTTAGVSLDDIDDMPPLEPIDGSGAAAPAAAAAPGPSSSRSTGNSFLSAFSNPLAAFAGLTGANRNSSSASPQRAAPTPAATGAGDDDDDDMPPLEPINGSTAASSTPARSGATTAARNDEDDDMPPLEPIDAGPTRPAASTARPPAAPTRGGDDDDEDMPPLEPIDSSSRTSTRLKKSGEETEDDMPVLEPIDSQRKADKYRFTEKPAVSSTATAGASTSGTSASSAPATGSARAAAAIDSDDELPPLEPIDEASPAPRASASTSTAPGTAPTVTTPTPARAGDDDEEMPPLEPIDDTTPATPAAPTAPAEAAAVAAAAPIAPADLQTDVADDGDWEDDDDENASDDEGEDGNSSDEESDDERLFPDGLPLDPIVPLALINRSFLHAARKVLYQNVVLASPYVATLVRDTLARTDPVGFVESDEVIIPPVEDAGSKRKLTRNVLCKFVKSLHFTTEIDCTLGRGGGQLYIDLIRMCAEQLEVLTLRPMFFKSATKPLLAALSELRQLKGIDFNTSADQKRPFMVTTPRVYKLMQRSWPDLEQLVITALRPAEDGPDEEEVEMWDIVDDVDGEDDSEDDGSSADESGSEENAKAESKDRASCEQMELSTSTDPVRKTPRGLRDLQLYGFNVQGSELDLILQDSKETLRSLALHRPGYLFKRDALAATLLTFGQNLTSLELILPSNWDPVAKLAPGQSRPPFPHRPKDYKKGEPSKEFLGKIGRYTYVLDAVMQCLPNLTRLCFDGPYASAHVFAWMPPSLKTVSFGNCPTISPSMLNKVLNKTYTRTKEVKRADGTVGNKSFQTKAASGLTCLTVTNDDLSWSEADIYSLQDTLGARDCCLHLSSDGGQGGLFPIFGGVQLGGLFGLGGVVRPGGAARGQARPPAAGPANFGAGLA